MDRTYAITGKPMNSGKVAAGIGVPGNALENHALQVFVRFDGQKLPARKIHSGHLVALRAVTAGTIGLVNARAILHIRRRVAVLGTERTGRQQQQTSPC